MARTSKRNDDEAGGRRLWQVYAEQIQRSRCSAKTGANGTQCRRQADVWFRSTRQDKRGRVQLTYNGPLCIECEYKLERSGAFELT